MDDLSELEERAAELRARFSAFIEDMGEFAPPFRELRADLAHIDESIESLSALNP